MPKPKIIIAKLGLDGHDRGAKVIARALAEAGFEVVYTGIRQTPSQVVETAIQEDAKLIGISILSGSHLELVGELMRIMKEKGVSIPVLVGGIIPPEDKEALLKMGIAGVYGPGTSLKEIIDIVKKLVGVS
ncbi:methylmalonyl-CoA mutase, subunit alpha, C-terminus protein [Vulcanisaeta moutnovskia 768-28]|uniref:Methylmalonyl-CoA mutase, subunit alpha, C-terminus protein n=1 Tax=Vulcanisaeta moutnovskia (strain 768-28) TaxID=985053 RepID=F0QX96_VULM7|nr:cobalamin B12-binding domain-containing protein [Vulcanisaeta moutnovskia]ADY01135.1 methylmalonyl-CoA mutase, subunit alpha, C-terminus protein [Vulcanisaeta moutnovskia 768-28]